MWNKRPIWKIEGNWCSYRNWNGSNSDYTWDVIVFEIISFDENNIVINAGGETFTLACAEGKTFNLVEQGAERDFLFSVKLPRGYFKYYEDERFQESNSSKSKINNNANSSILIMENV